MKSYEQFWTELKKAYPVTKGEIKIPVATQLDGSRNSKRGE